MCDPCFKTTTNLQMVSVFCDVLLVYVVNVDIDAESFTDISRICSIASFLLTTLECI